MKVFDFLSNEDISGSDIVFDELLPLVHTTVYQDFEKGTFPAINILEQMKLKLNDEHLLYFFYGRPVRRPKKEMKIPVVFIIKPILKDINKVYPFDSGAYDKYVENHRIDPLTPISNYELPNDFFSIQQYINAIFGSNYNYYHGRRKTDDELPDIVKQCRKTNNDLNNLLKLIAEKKEDGIDGRRKSVEIQSASDYDLSGKLLAIVVPNTFQNYPELIEIRKTMGVELLSYECSEIFTASELIRKVYITTKKYYVKKYM
jgi:hypothetical protein